MESTIVTRARLLAVATVVGASCALTSTAPAQAADPNCTFVRDSFTVLRKDGTMLIAQSSSGGKAVGPKSTLYVTQQTPLGDTDVLARGTARGAIPARGAIVEFTFDGGGRSDRYFGVITTEGAILGTDGIGWSSPNGSVSCTKLEPGAGAKTATVLKPTDIFDAPNGTGQPYLDANGRNRFAPRGQVALVAPELCDTSTNWCRIVPPSGVNGKAFIYIGEDYGSYP
ncbi:hypothetical protein H7K45_20970 [Mycobacterium yunnanensis]|uniref:MspA protein n=1 Tax=Mycobacterium yunnanensis TaxID=368477 RepID=A0A9X2Z4S2_9MYCO|nr:hypothetical protein [Mycobacterium yunnanensis]MCV7423029.1 hypothetical protein [Mycobacterium yunnanensis]